MASPCPPALHSCGRRRAEGTGRAAAGALEGGGAPRVTACSADQFSDARKRMNGKSVARCACAFTRRERVLYRARKISRFFFFCATEIYSVFLFFCSARFFVFARDARIARSALDRSCAPWSSSFSRAYVATTSRAYRSRSFRGNSNRRVCFSKDSGSEFQNLRKTGKKKTLKKAKFHVL